MLILFLEVQAADLTKSAAAEVEDEMVTVNRFGDIYTTFKSITTALSNAAISADTAYTVSAADCGSCKSASFLNRHESGLSVNNPPVRLKAQ